MLPFGWCGLPTRDEEVEKDRKRKSATTELPREATLTFEEEPKTEKGGGFRRLPRATSSLL